jgi:hypothetical protein
MSASSRGTLTLCREIGISSRVVSTFSREVGTFCRGIPTFCRVALFSTTYERNAFRAYASGQKSPLSLQTVSFEPLTIN